MPSLPRRPESRKITSWSRKTAKSFQSDVKEVVIRDRQHLAEDGIFVIIAIVDARNGKVKTSQDIISRGFIYLKESQELLREVRKRTRTIVEGLTTGPT